MPATIQESTAKLSSGDILEWSKHKTFSAGQIVLETAGARRIFSYLINQNQSALAKADESLFAGLIAAWDNEDYDPKDHAAAAALAADGASFRLAKIETHGFGGLNIFDGPVFTLDVNRQSWCLEGQNGSGKTSLASAIIWGLTGRRIIEHAGPALDNGKREPVFSTDGKEIGTWPPLATYPTSVEDLKKDARVSVKLIFQDQNDTEAFAERVTVSKADGTIENETATVDPRLVSAPQFIESGILMPARMTQISFGDKSQTLYEAVKALTGLDLLGAVGDGATVLTNGGRKFRKYAKDKGIAKIEANYGKQFDLADEQAKLVNLDLATCAVFSGENVVEELDVQKKSISETAGKYAETLESVVSNDIDLSDQQGRKQVFDAVGVAKNTVQKATENISAFSILKALFSAKEDGHLDPLPDAVIKAKAKLASALEWHIKQENDLKLRLKALASEWFEEPENLESFANCPLCEGDLQTPQQKELQKELAALKPAGEEAGRKLDDACRSIRDELISALPEGLRRHVNELGRLEPKSDIVNGAIRLFTESQPFTDVITGVAETLKKVIPSKSEDLPAFEPAGEFTGIDGEPDHAKNLRKQIHEFVRVVELAEWWVGNRTEFTDFWKNIVGLVPEGEKPGAETVIGQITVVEEALAASQPYDAILKRLNELSEFAVSWRAINTEQKKRDAISDALMPLKSLRIFVDNDTAQSINGLSDRMKDFLKRIHIEERLDFHDAGLKKKEVHVHGSFSEGMKFDALPIANTSWLKAILWAFIFALREQSIEAYGSNPFPLILLDDPQQTFDPRNKRKWAQELARIANLDETEAEAGQLFLTTYERQFFTLITELESMKGQEGLVAQADENSGSVTIINGNILEREYCIAKNDNDDSKARSYIRQVRIYVEKLLKYMLRGEGNHIAKSHLQNLRKELKELRNAHITPYNRNPTRELLKALNGNERGIKLINNPPHDDGETTGVAESTDVHEYWNKTLKKCIHRAFHAYAAYETYHGDPRTYDYPENVVKLPVGMNEEVRKATLFQTGLVASASSDGRTGDGVLRIEEWENAEQATLHNHEIYRLTANTLEPVASLGNLVIVSNYADVDQKHLVAAAVGEQLLARRYQVSDTHPEIAVLTAQATNPYELLPPVITPLTGLEMKKIVGTLFTNNVSAAVIENELEATDDSSEFFTTLDQARLFKVQGRSSEPIALDDQYLMVGHPIDDPTKWSDFDGKLVVGIDVNGASYFKRLRSPRAGIIVIESLNPDGTTPAELLSTDGREGIPQLAQIIPVLGVLFELPDQK